MVLGTRMALSVSEAQLQIAVIDLARYRQWTFLHLLAAKQEGEEFRVHAQGDPGFPDLVLARDGVVLFRELKRQHEQLAPAQRKWERGLGGAFAVWRPSDWNLGTIAQELR
jgi:hypothetical protein